MGQARWLPSSSATLVLALWALPRLPQDAGSTSVPAFSLPSSPLVLLAWGLWAVVEVLLLDANWLACVCGRFAGEGQGKS